MVSNMMWRQATDAEETRVLPEDIVFPITRIADLQLLERKLSDVETFKSVESICFFLTPRKARADKPAHNIRAHNAWAKSGPVLQNRILYD